MFGRFSNEHNIIAAKSQVALALDFMNRAQSPPTESEICLVKRGKSLEVWTKVPFAKGKLVLVPFATELKDRYWTYGKAVSVSCALLPAGKTLAIDGRLHQKPPKQTEGDDSDRSFSMFWAVQRTTDAKDANLKLEWVSVCVSIAVTLHMKRSFDTATEPGDLKLPLLVNTAKIDAHTRLIALDDTELSKTAQKK